MADDSSTPMSQFVFVHVQQTGCLPGPATRRHQGCFGQSVTRTECLTAKTCVGESIGELLQRVRDNRLGTAKRQLPTAQIKRLGLSQINSVNAQLIREVGCAADGGLVVRDRSKPTHRPSKKGPGRHQDRMTADVQRLKDSADQSHVMEWRQPEQTALEVVAIVIGPFNSECMTDRFQVAQ